MRGTRWLLLVAILAIICGVGLTYRAQKRALREQAPAMPARLPDELNSTAQKWVYSETTSTYTKIEATADDFRESRDSSRVDLRGVTMKIHSKTGQTYNLVKSAAAAFFKADHRLRSDGEVEITLNVPETGELKHTPVSIKSSGVDLDTESGRVETEQPSSFVFENGTGASTGAFYDPASHQLLMKKDARLQWCTKGPHAKPMLVEGGSLEYHEDTSEVWLKPWGRLTRENTVIEGENPVIHLEEDGAGSKFIRKIDTTKAHGTDSYPHRKLQYSADELWTNFDDDGLVQKIIAQTNARLVATSDSAETTVTAFHVEMNFVPDATGDQNVLTTVDTSGNSEVRSQPVATPGHPPGETHVLRSDKMSMKMRDGGREIANVTTATPGSLEFIPNQPSQHHRTLNGDNMFIAYGAQNRLDSFRADNVRTRTDPTADELKRKRAPTFTASHQMSATFDKAGKMAGIEQNGDFTYEEGDRRARAAKATLDSATDMMVLDTTARFWDSTGSTSADRIRLDQKSGDFVADGHVNSSRLPDKDQKKNSEMLSGDDPLQAQAQRMESKNRNREIHYQGNALMWQGANRIQADTIDLDREKHSLIANGNVVTDLWQQPDDAKADPKSKDAKKENEKPKQPAQPVLTEVHAPHLVYTDTNRLAYYSGGALLKRPNMVVKAREIHAYLAESGSDSRLEKAIADGSVNIFQRSPDRTRTGTGEHSEYYPDEQKILLTGGMPKMVDSLKGTTVAPAGLTYWADDDRLLLNGSKDQPVQTRFKRKK
jgi:lipopolysaccharide export system protein LptA